MGSSQVVAEWTATGSGHPGASGLAAFSHEAITSTGVLSEIRPGQPHHQLTRQVNGKLLAHGQAVKGQVVMRHLSRVSGIGIQRSNTDLTVEC